MDHEVHCGKKTCPIEMSGQRLNKFLSLFHWQQYNLCSPEPTLLLKGVLLPYHFKCSTFCSCLNCYIQSNVHVIIKSCENLRSAQKYFPPLPITHQNMLYAFAALTNVFSTTGNVLAFPEYFKLLFPQCEILSHPKCNMWFLGCSSCNDRNGEAHD